jgi:NADH dehydrogenase [ubiquinone] 1 alpha subcomplex assembly factor 2
VQEQQIDVARQAQLKLLAKAADDRWAAKPSVLDKPRRGNFELGVGEGEVVGTKEEVGGGKERGALEERGHEKDKLKGKENPWKVNRGRAGEEWQPEAWTPDPGKR